MNTSELINGVAIIGMAGRFPGAGNVAQFWRNQCNGVEAISRFRVEELESPEAAALAKSPDFVAARSVLEGVDLFDASFFGIYPKEAEVMDPQHRVFLECCWEVLEEAGYDPLNTAGLTGVFAGCSTSTYFLRHVCTDRKFIEDYVGGYQISGYPYLLGSNLDFLATRVAYKLNLKGPAFTLQAGCSTSLLAVCQACQALQTFQCDMAIAGGVSITFPQKRGYIYQEGGMGSPDGYCRTFDEQANGTVFGSGAATVLLKRLEDAIADGDHIYAVIRGYATNNDGASKVGYTAPSVEGQAKVVAMAQASAGVDPATITYIEAHGTATPLGDPIEVAALTQAFRAKTQARGFCVLGTAKTNVGHLDIAAGATGLIHAVQAIRHAMLPPTLHFRRPNPKLNLETSPFTVNTSLREWKSGKEPRRAGVSAFGVGGTNAHVVLEQAPAAAASPEDPRPQLLLLSAKTPEAADAAAGNLAKHLEAHPEANLADVAYTLQTGRHHFEHRRMLVASDIPGALRALGAPGAFKTQSAASQLRNPSLNFLFPGQGVQYPGMGQELYRQDDTFRSTVDQCADILLPHLGIDLRQVLYPADVSSPEAARELTRTAIAQSAIFTVEYALAQMWRAWGTEPKAMVGHSVGEFVAACLAGVFSLEDALFLVASRGRLMQELPAGAMLSIRLPEAEVTALLDNRISLAAANGPSLHVVSGPTDVIDDLERRLNQSGAACRKLVTSHAFHSAMMDPAVAPFTEMVKRIRLAPPKIPYVSTLTGDWITAGQALDPVYWGGHLRQTVRFSQAIRKLIQAPEPILLEVGPGATMATLARQHLNKPGDAVAISSLPGVSASQSDLSSMLSALGSLWLAGVQTDWARLHRGIARQRVSLPTYPFQRKRYWIEAPTPAASQDKSNHASVPTVTEQGLEPLDTVIRKIQIANYLPEPTMECQMPSLPTSPAESTRSLRLCNELKDIIEELSGTDLSEVEPGTTFLDIGFDSLFLTQVTQAIQGKYGLKITFRQLLDQESSVDALAAYIDDKLPPEAIPAAQPQPAAAPVGAAWAAPAAPLPISENAAANGPAAGNASLAERIVRDQLQAMTQLMAQQLQILRGTVPAAPEAIAAPAVGPLAAAPAPAPSQAASAPATDSGKAEFKSFGRYKPVQKGHVGGLAPRQERHLAELIERYNRRTAGSKRMTQENRKWLADPRVVSGFRSQWKEIIYPIVTVRSRGSRLWDVDGNEYIDLVNGFGPIALGHLPEFLSEAVRHQLEQGIETGPQSPLAGKVAKLVCELTGMERATFCNTGSEAVMAALRVSRTVTGRKKIVLFTGSYHGTFDEVLIKGVTTKAGALRSVPVAPGIPQEKVDNVYVLDYGTPESLEFIRSHANELAAVLIEPVQSRHPGLQPREFVRELRAITKASGTALIFDEVVTGFRVHQGGVQALWDIRADLATYGKVLGGGMPIGVLAGSADFMDALDGGAWSFGDESNPEKGMTFFAGTFVRHPLALAACQSVMTYLKEQGPQLQENLNRRTAALVKRLSDLFEQSQVPSHIESFGSIFYFSFPVEQRFGSLFYFHLREKGIHIQEGFPCFLTTTHSDADMDRIFRAFEESVREMQDGEMFPAPASQAVSPVSLPPVAEGPREAPLTESQLEIFLSAQLSPEASCSYNESITLRLNGDLDEAALAESLRRLLQRHEALRATFSEHGEFQRFAPALDPCLTTTDLSSFDAAGGDEQVRHILDEDAREPFDLMNGPLVRVKLLKLQPRSHVLVFTSHHIVCDGWSTNVILDELSKLYTGLHEGRQVDLPEAMSFEAYSRSQAVHFESAEGKEIEDYWVAQFREAAPLLDLPLDRPRPSLKVYDGATCRRIIPAETYRRIKKAGAQQKCTLFVTLLSGFQTLLSRLSGQDDVVVGIPAAGQSLLDNQALVGHCVNFLPLRGRFAGDPTMQAYLGQVKRTLLDAYDHQNYTYGRLIRKLSIVRDPSRLPLMEVQFNLERVGTSMTFSGLEVSVDPNPKAFVNHDLFLNIVESDDGLTLDCDYNTRLFDEQTIDGWMRHYVTLLESFASDATQPISRLALLTPEEHSVIATKWNRTPAAYPQCCVHQLIEEQAARTPDAIAVDYEGRQLTYAELNRRADRLAGYLAGLGVRPGVLVGLLVDRSLNMMVGLLGILKSGGAYVPLDPIYPPERISFVLEDAKVPVLLTEQSLGYNLAAGSARIVHLDSGWDSIEQAGGAPVTKPSPEDLAYVIYTSGSTGKPKGVEIPHRAVVNLLCSMRKKPGLRPEDVFLAVTTLSFDIAALELYLPLVTGARLVIANRDCAADGSQLLAKLQASGATVMQATPVTFRLLIEAGWSGDRLLKVLCGGEALPRELVDQLLDRTASLWNMYGPTETTIWSSTIELQSQEGIVPLGPPIDNTQFYVLDSHGQLAPLGVPGELHIGGDGLARGYWNRPELTSEKFIANPFAARPGSRLYKTGDLVRLLPDGNLEFFGRQDHQVKLRGFRIELGEVEAVLRRHPAVNEAVALIREDRPGDKRLVAYVTGEQPAIAAASLRNYLGEHLPAYMVPSLVISLQALPLTPNGKVDRKALPAPDNGIPATKEYVEPETPRQKALVDIWAEVLHLRQIGIYDNLFELGADSIHVFRIAARATAAGFKVMPIQILQHPTVSALASALEDQTVAERAVTKGSIRRVSREAYRVNAGSV